jgi:hypothetical protein
VTEQLRTVRQQIVECHILERQLVQVLQRLQMVAPASHADGCPCLGSETSETQEPAPVSLPQKGTAMSPSTLEPLTILAPSETASPRDASCGCGCACGPSLTQLALPQEAVDREKAQPTRS